MFVLAMRLASSLNSATSNACRSATVAGAPFARALTVFDQSGRSYSASRRRCLAGKIVKKSGRYDDKLRVLSKRSSAAVAAADGLAEIASASARK